MYLLFIKNSEDYLKIMSAMFAYNYLDPKVRNSESWLPIEIATSNKDLDAIRLIYYYMLKRRQLKIMRNISRVTKFLAQIPDFYIEMKWDVNVPLLSAFCPNDVCKIHKIGSNVRLDFTFIEFKNLTCVRAPSSYIVADAKIFHVGKEVATSLLN